ARPRGRARRAVGRRGRDGGRLPGDGTAGDRRGRGPHDRPLRRAAVGSAVAAGADRAAHRGAPAAAGAAVAGAAPRAGHAAPPRRRGGPRRVGAGPGARRAVPGRAGRPRAVLAALLRRRRRRRAERSPRPPAPGGRMASPLARVSGAVTRQRLPWPRPGTGGTCPYCFASVAPQRILFRCRGQSGRRRGCAPVLDEKLAAYTGSTAGASLPPVFAPPGRLAGGRAGRADCPDCGLPTGNRACPECHNPLPSAYCDSPGRIVALVGAKNAGKSTYIAVLLHELMNRVGTELDASLVACDDRTIERYKRDFARPLLEERRLLPTTASAATGPREPLVYLLTRTRRGRFSRPRNDSLALVLFDTAGEDLRS